jgi:hypothetical protein
MLLATAAIACTIDFTGWGFGGEEATATFPPVPTATPIPTLQPTTEPGVVPPPTQPPPTQPPPTQPYDGPGSKALGVYCLPGTWQMDHSSVINYMNLSMIGVDEYGFTPLGSEGKLELQIIPGHINLLAENFKVDIGVNIGGVANVNINDFYMQANGSANFTGDDAELFLTEVTYDVSGTIVSSIGTFNMDLFDLLSVAYALGFAGDIHHPTYSTRFDYSCSGDILTIVVNEFASVSFYRIN